MHSFIQQIFIYVPDAILGTRNIEVSKDKYFALIESSF